MIPPVSHDPQGRPSLASLSDRLPFPPPAPRKPKKTLFGRKRRNRREGPPVPVTTVLAQGFVTVGRHVLVALKYVVALAVLVAAALAGRAGVQHLVRSPHFAVKEIELSPSYHAPRELVLAVGGVSLGDRLLLVDTDRVERRLLRLPWIDSVKVRRALPSTLTIDIVERHAAAAVVLGGLYLIDERGHPFKKATAAEAAGEVVITGLSRSLFVAAAEPAEAALREALGLLRMYQRPTAAGRARSTLSEIRVDPRAGFTLVLLEGGTEIVLGRTDLPSRLEHFDRLATSLGEKGLAELRVVHLDGPNLGRVPVLPRPAPEEDETKNEMASTASTPKVVAGPGALSARPTRAPARATLASRSTAPDRSSSPSRGPAPAAATPDKDDADADEVTSAAAAAADTGPED